MIGQGDIGAAKTLFLFFIFMHSSGDVRELRVFIGVCVNCCVIPLERQVSRYIHL